VHDALVLVQALGLAVLVGDDAQEGGADEALANGLRHQLLDRT
jgi:hypothetical protein